MAEHDQAHGLPDGYFHYEAACTDQNIRLFLIAPRQGTDLLRISMRACSFDRSNTSHKTAESSWSFFAGLLADPARLLQRRRTDENNISYTAISYVWGDDTDTVVILCNDRKLRITRSLHGALWRLREKGHIGNIWADAISIDQNNITEKTEQIRMMGDIYQQAQEVFIWLGEEEENDELGLALMYTIRHQITLHKLQGNGQANLDFSAEGLGLTQWPPECWQGMLSIMQRPWFWRAWAVQEYLRARSRIFQCGKLEIPGALISATFNSLGKHHGLKYVALKHRSKESFNHEAGNLLGPMLEFEDVIPGIVTLIGLLSRARALQSSEPKDRLFALVGLSKDVDTSFIDYSRDIDGLLREIARDRFRKAIAAGKSQAVFYYLGLVSRKDSAEGRTSWALFHENPIPFRGLETIFPMRNILMTQARVDLSDPKILKIRGKVVDGIATMLNSEAWTEPASKVNKDHAAQASAQYRKVLASYTQVQQLVSGLGQYPTGEALDEVFWRSLICNTEGENLEASSDMGECLQSNRESFALAAVWTEHHTGSRYMDTPAAEVFLELGSMVPDVRWVPSAEAMHAPGDKFWSEIEEYLNLQHERSGRWSVAATLFTWGRRYFKSNSGYVGLVPDHAIESDLICAFYGSRWPFVIRPCPEGFRLIGSCYMHGLMEGGAIALPCLTSFEEGWICLV